MSVAEEFQRLCHEQVVVLEDAAVAGVRVDAELGAGQQLGEAITSGVQASDHGLAGALFTTSQQTGAAVGLAILATAAASATDGHSGSLVDGYRLSFLIATGLAVLAAIIVALQLSSKSDRVESAHQQAGPGGPSPAPPAPVQLGKS